MENIDMSMEEGDEFEMLETKSNTYTNGTFQAVREPLQVPDWPPH